MSDLAGWFARLAAPALAAIARAAGIGDELATRIDRVEWHWARPAVLWIGLALLVPLGIWIARRHATRMPWLTPGLRRTLSACRMGVLALVVFILAGPFVRLVETVEERPIVAIIRDGSASMELPVGRIDTAAVPGIAGAAGLDQPAPDDAEAVAAVGERLARWTRRELLDAILAAQAPTTLRQLGEAFELRDYAVGRQPRRAAAAHQAAAIEPDPSGTALGAAVEMAIDDASGRGLAAIVLLTDGVSTEGLDPLSVVRRAAEASGGVPRGPVFAVPIGGAEPPPDLAVADVLAPAEVTLDDSVAITATIVASGLDGEAVVELRDAAGTPLEARTIPATDGRRQVSFTWKATEPGSSLLSVAVLPRDGEATLENNVGEVAVTVTTRSFRTLVVDDAARWDTRFLDHAIRRDTGFAPTIVLAAAGADDLPADAAGWAAFDLVLIGDVPATLLDAPRQAALVEAVETEGVGVVFQPGGEHLPREYAGAPIARLFPVECDPRADAVVEAPDFEPLRMAVTARGAMHPAFAISGDARSNRERWSDMPEFFRAAAVERPRPTATVLAEVNDPRGRGSMPLVVEATAGRGRTAWVGTEETFRWRRNVGDPIFWRFWGQMLRSIARRDDRPADAAWLVVEPDRCEPGSTVLVELNLPPAPPGGAAAARPAEPPAQSITVTLAGRSTPLELVAAERPGLYRGGFTPAAAGRHVLGATSAAGPLSADLVVAPSRRELARTAVDRPALRAVADFTGGAVLEADAFSTLAYRLEEATVEATRSLEDDVWDTWPVLVLLVGLYGVDIAIRRLTGSA